MCLRLRFRSPEAKPPDFTPLLDFVLHDLLGEVEEESIHILAEGGFDLILRALVLVPKVLKVLLSQPDQLGRGD